MIDQTALAIGLIVLVALLFLVERIAPLRRSSRPLLGRVLVNVGISALAFAVAMLWVRPTALAVLEWSTNQPLGLVQAVKMPFAAQFVLSFLLMDLTFYWWHVANHRIPFLWRFHNVHHIDPDLDVSTAFRFHFGEVALSAGFRVVQVSTIGPTALTFAIYELVFQANAAFHHSNVRLPIRLEQRRIAFHPAHKLTAVRGDARELLFEGTPPFAYDLLVAIPPHRAPALVREAGLAGETGWIPVDRQTLATSHDRVFAIGDVTTVPIPGRWKPDVPLMLPKAGVFAHAQALVVASRIAAAIRGAASTTTFCGDGFCMFGSR